MSTFDKNFLFLLLILLSNHLVGVWQTIVVLLMACLFTAVENAWERRRGLQEMRDAGWHV